MTHSDGRPGGETVADWFSEQYPKSRAVGEPQQFPGGKIIERPGIVHRLDTETSGALVLAKTPEAYTSLKEAFQARKVKKTYLAFVYGTPKEQEGTITFPIGRSRKDSRLRSAQPKARGVLREATTRFETVGDIGTHTLLKVMPETGRTHQIRAHLKAIHHPVVCDKLYAPNHPCDLGFSRLGLHAYKLEIQLLSGKSEIITAPVPQELREAVLKFPGGDALVAGA